MWNNIVVKNLFKNLNVLLVIANYYISKSMLKLKPDQQKLYKFGLYKL